MYYVSRPGEHSIQRIAAPRTAHIAAVASTVLEYARVREPRPWPRHSGLGSNIRNRQRDIPAKHMKVVEAQAIQERTESGRESIRGWSFI